MFRRTLGLVLVGSTATVIACSDEGPAESTASQSAPVAFRDDSHLPTLSAPSVSTAFPIDAAPPAASQTGFNSAELNGTYLVAWQDQRNDGGDLYASRVSAAGSVLDTAPIAVTSTAETDSVPRVTRLGDGYMLTFGRSGSDRAARVSSGGVPLGEGDLPFPPDAYLGSGTVRYQIAAGGAGGGLLASFYETLLGKYILSTREIATDGTISTTEIVQETSNVGSNNVTLLRDLKAYGSEFLLSTGLDNPSYRFRDVARLSGSGASLGGAWGWSADYASSFDFAGGTLGVGVAYRDDGYFSLPNPSVLTWNGNGCSLDCQLVDTEKEKLAAVGEHFLLTFLDSGRSGKPLMGALVALDGSRSAPFDLEVGLTDWQVTCSEYVGCLLTFTKDDGGYSRVFGRVLDFGLPPAPGGGTGGAGTGGAGTGGAGTGGAGGSAGGAGGAAVGGASQTTGGSGGVAGLAGAGAVASGGSAGNSLAGSGNAAGATGGSGTSSGDGGCRTSPGSNGVGWPWLLLAAALLRRRRTR